MHAVDEDDSENVEEATDDEEDLQAWCLYVTISLRDNVLSQ